MRGHVRLSQVVVSSSLFALDSGVAANLARPFYFLLLLQSSVFFFFEYKRCIIRFVSVFLLLLPVLHKFGQYIVLNIYLRASKEPFISVTCFAAEMTLKFLQVPIELDLYPFFMHNLPVLITIIRVKVKRNWRSRRERERQGFYLCPQNQLIIVRIPKKKKYLIYFSPPSLFILLTYLFWRTTVLESKSHC